MRNLLTKYAATLLLIAAASSSCIAACGSTTPRPDPVQIVVDCTAANQGQIAALALSMLGLLTGATPNWPAIETQAIDAGETIGGCALAAVIQGYLSPAKGIASASPENTRAARRTFENYRVNHARNATYRTSAGDL